MDLYRARSFQKRSSGEFLTLSDPSGRACAMYGVAKQLVVHDEWVNSPATFVIDRKGIVRYAYVGDYWGDRPSADTIFEEVKKALR